MPDNSAPQVPTKDRPYSRNADRKRVSVPRFESSHNDALSPSHGYVHRNAETDDFGFPVVRNNVDHGEKESRRLYQQDALREQSRTSSNQDLIVDHGSLTRPRTRSTTRNHISQQQPQPQKQFAANSAPEQRYKSRHERIDELMNSSAVQQQLSDRTYRPFFIYTVTAIQLVVLIVSYIRNLQLTGSLIETQPFNIMIGPTSMVLISMGARFVPCMKTNTLVPWKSMQCPIQMDPSGLCSVAEICENNFNQWWRFIVPIFLHGGLLHILLNCWFQWDLGGDLERKFGALRVAPIYFISGIFGFIFGANFAPELSPSVGASGALFGLVGCLFADLVQHWKIVVRPWKELFKLLLMILISFVVGLLPGIDNFSHIGGFIAGVLSSFVFLPNVYFGKWDRIRKYGITVGALALLIFLYVGLLVSFYNNEASKVCPWCKYLSCMPLLNTCD